MSIVMQQPGTKTATRAAMRRSGRRDRRGGVRMGATLSDVEAEGERQAAEYRDHAPGRRLAQGAQKNRDLPRNRASDVGCRRSLRINSGRIVSVSCRLPQRPDRQGVEIISEARARFAVIEQNATPESLVVGHFAT